MFDTILVATDGSGAAKTAMESALALARRFDASLHAIHVVDVDDMPSSVRSEASAELGEQGQIVLERFEERAASADVAITTRLVESTQPTHQEIVDDAVQHDVDLIVMGTHGRTGLDRVVIGSVAERTLRISPIPVLTVHEDAGTDADVETILVPTDGSETATAAADSAIALAAATGAALHAIHVVDLTAVSGEYGSVEILDALNDAGQQAVEDVRERANEAGVESVEASVLNGTPARSILNYADERDVDVIVLGTHGRTGLDRYLLGSVTEKIVRLATRPVLTVSSHEEG